MYYSVPTLRRASYLKMDLPTFQAAASAGPADMETDDSSSNQGSTVVRRQSRVSTECHPDYLFTDFYTNDNGMIQILKMRIRTQKKTSLWLLSKPGPPLHLLLRPNRWDGIVKTNVKI
jgi:hypothetical protein